MEKIEIEVELLDHSPLGLFCTIACLQSIVGANNAPIVYNEAAAEGWVGGYQEAMRHVGKLLVGKTVIVQENV